MAVNFSNFNGLNRTISNNKTMKFKNCVADTRQSSKGTTYSVFEVELDYAPAQEYTKKLRQFIPGEDANENKVRIFTSNINQFAIAAMGKEKFATVVGEATSKKTMNNLEYATFIAELVRKHTKVGQDVELFQVYCPKDGDGRYHNWSKTDGFTVNRNKVSDSDVVFDGAKDDKIYRCIPQDVTYTGTFYRFNGDDKVVFEESPKAAAFRELAQKRMEQAQNNDAPSSTPSTSIDTDNDW